MLPSPGVLDASFVACDFDVNKLTEATWWTAVR
jgi:hypothetical protein